MGNVRWGIPEKLVSLLKESFNISVFVETGTYEGDTAYWASLLFDKVLTIESSYFLYKKCKFRFRDCCNIELIYGDSSCAIKNISKYCDQDHMLFWLDAHWFKTEENIVAGKNAQCPLLYELDAINKLNVTPFIIIDDAHHFLSPCSKDMCYDQWPTLSNVIKKLEAVRESYIVVIEDCIVSVPIFCAKIIREYCITVNELSNT